MHSATFALEKRDPKGWQWRKRHFVVDDTRGALVYYADEAKQQFKGAIPLSSVSNLAVDQKQKQKQLNIDIPGRSFRLREPFVKPAASAAAKPPAAEPNPAEGNAGAAQDASRAGSAPAVDFPGFLSKLKAAIENAPEPDPNEKDELPPNHWKQSARYLAMNPREEGPVYSCAAHPGYPVRAKVLSGSHSWDVALPAYAPQSYTAPGVVVALPAEGHVSWTGPLRSENSQPLNPSGRTGLAGQGELPRSGPNAEVRVVVTKEENGAKYVVAVRKAPGGEWTLPGGLLPPGKAGAEPPSVKTLQAAFRLQAGNSSLRQHLAMLDALFVGADAPVHAGIASSAPEAADGAALDKPKPAWLLHLGYCDHSANTDNAWLESAVGHFHCSPDALKDMILAEGAGVNDVRWIKVPPMHTKQQGFFEDLRPAHRRWVRTALLRHGVNAASA